jgi:hypothetical protein
MRTEIRPGAVIDHVAPAELKAHLDAANRDWFREKARGVTPFEFEGAVTVANGDVTIPGPGQEGFTPNSGFVVQIYTIRVVGLASGDILSVYRNAVGPRPMDQIVMPATGTLAILREGSHGMFLNDGRSLVFNGTGLTATGDIVVYGEGVTVPAPDAYKLLL